MNPGFDIRPGRYLVPEIGNVDTTKPVSDETAVALYLNKRFPFISVNKNGVATLKRFKLTKEQLGNLILRAQTAEEVDLILKVRRFKVLANIAAHRKRALEKK